jgi:YHS domain-containing protein
MRLHIAARRVRMNLSVLALIVAAVFIYQATISFAAEEERSTNTQNAISTDHPSETTIRSEVIANGPVEIGKVVPLTLTLRDKDGNPVTFDDLREIHTKKIHMLIVDPSLSDYQHVHPNGTDKAGAFKFEFEPKHGGTYYFFADLLPVKSNAQEYSLAKMAVPGEQAKLEKKENRTVTVDGYKFDLSFEHPELVQGKGNKATLKISTADGKPMDKLEPLMGAFAHMVAFTEDRKHVLHVHPQGKEPENADERGGPELTFWINPASAGYQQLYAQIQVNGKNVFAPFGLDVQERKVPTNISGIFEEVDSNLEKLKNIVELGQLDQVHGIAFWTSDVMQGLSASTDLKAGVKDKLVMPLKRIKSYANSLDRYGDAHDAEQTKSVLARFSLEVESIRELIGAPKSTTAAEEADVKLVHNKNCPVSSMPVGSMEPGAAIVYKGQKIGLCCSGCKATFDKDPDAYLKKAQASAQH